MQEQTQVQDQIALTISLLRSKLGVRGKTLTRAVKKSRRRLPRRIYKQALKLALVESRAAHPKLRLTLDSKGLDRAARDVQAHLASIDLADRRKGWWLGMTGGLAFNILLFVALALGFLYWKGFI